MGALFDPEDEQDVFAVVETAVSVADVAGREKGVLPQRLDGGNVSGRCRHDAIPQGLEGGMQRLRLALAFVDRSGDLEPAGAVIRAALVAAHGIDVEPVDGDADIDDAEPRERGDGIPVLFRERRDYGGGTPFGEFPLKGSRQGAVGHVPLSGHGWRAEKENEKKQDEESMQGTSSEVGGMPLCDRRNE